jgi:two-component system, LytTR family, sensor histidine kinase AlgZ
MDVGIKRLRRPHGLPTMIAAASLERQAQCLRAASGMAVIIRQNPNQPALPDFRNLGTILRILVAVNLGAAVVAFARAPQSSAAFGEWIESTGIVEPYLLLVLAVLWAMSPWLSRVPFGVGAALIAAVTLVSGRLIFAAMDNLVPLPPGSLLRWLAFGLIAVAILLFYFRLRARALSPAITEARLQALQARIRPHFLFNSINAVLSLVRSDPKRAEVALEDMADLFRVLMRDNRDLTPLEDEVELCRQYLELEQLRLGDRLTVDWNVKSMPADALVPPLMLQPLLENAVYHGIEPSSTPGTVSINLFLSRGEVHAILKNPYRATGGNHHSGNKMALANVRERLALHFDAEASLESRVTKDSYEVHIRIPYRTEATSSATGVPTVTGPMPGRGDERSRDSNSHLAMPEAARG